MKETHSSTFLVRDMDTLRVISDPTRAQIFEMLAREAGTVRHVAEKMGLAASKLYYHFNLLEKHGLIRVCETRQVGNLIEKWYSTVADSIDFDPELFSFNSPERNENVMSVVRTTIDATREDLIRSLQARFQALEQGSPQKERHVVLSRTQVRISDEQAAFFQQKVTELIQELEQSDQGLASGRDDLQPYAMTIVFYPNFYYRDEPSPSVNGKDTQ